MTLWTLCIIPVQYVFIYTKINISKKDEKATNLVDYVSLVNQVIQSDVCLFHCQQGSV